MINEFLNVVYVHDFTLSISRFVCNLCITRKLSVWVDDMDFKRQEKIENYS